MRSSLLASLLVLAASAACSTTMSQAKLAVADDKDHIARADALNVMPEAICKRIESCNGFGKDKKFGSMDDCLASQRNTWAKVWSEDKCGAPHAVAAGKVKECKERASAWQCGSNVLDFGGLVTECGAGDVCRD